MRYAIFASLAFLAMYRDVTVLLLASLITTIDHVLGCFLWPQSVYGVAHVSPLGLGQRRRAAWRVEDVLLVLAIRKSQSDMLGDARASRRRSTRAASALEREVAERQRTERLLSLQYVITRVLAGANSLPEAAPLILRIMGENQGWHVGELWEVDEGRAVPALRGHLARRRLPATSTTWSGGARRASRPTWGCPGASGSATCRSGSRTWPRSRRCRWRRFAEAIGAARRRSRSRCATAPR